MKVNLSWIRLFLLFCRVIFRLSLAVSWALLWRWNSLLFKFIKFNEIWNKKSTITTRVRIYIVRMKEREKKKRWIRKLSSNCLQYAVLNCLVRYFSIFIIYVFITILSDLKRTHKHFAKLYQIKCIWRCEK